MLTLIEKLAQRCSRYRCDCGKELIAFTANVTRGHTTSCGCARRLATSVRSLTHGHKANGKRSRAYVAWVNMKARCGGTGNKVDNENYRKRGITVCQRWRDSFEAFLADMGDPPPKMTLERTDNDKGYSPGNCRWATRAEQNNNRRNNVRYTLNGRSLTLSEWSRETGIGRVTLLKRIQRGVPISVALTAAGVLRWPQNSGAIAA